MLITSFPALSKSHALHSSVGALSAPQLAPLNSGLSSDSFQRVPANQASVLHFGNSNPYEKKYLKWVSKLEDTNQKLERLRVAKHEYHTEKGSVRLGELNAKLNEEYDFRSLIELKPQIKTAQTIYQLEKQHPELHALRMSAQQREDSDEAEEQFQAHRDKAYAKAAQDKEFRQAFNRFEKLQGYYIYDDTAQSDLKEAEELEQRLQKESPELYRDFLEREERQGKLDEAIELQTKLKTRYQNLKALMPDLIASKTVVHHPKFNAVVDTLLDLEYSVGEVEELSETRQQAYADEQQAYRDFCETKDALRQYPDHQKFMQQASTHAKHDAVKSSAVSQEMMNAKETPFQRTAKLIQGLFKNSQSKSQLDTQLAEMPDEQVEAVYRQLFQPQLPVPEHEPNAKGTLLAQKLKELTNLLSIEHAEEAPNTSQHHLSSQGEQQLAAGDKARKTKHEKLVNPHSVAEATNISSGSVHNGLLDYQEGAKQLSDYRLRTLDIAGPRLLAEREEERRLKAEKEAEEKKLAEEKAQKNEELRKAKRETKRLDKLLKESLALRQLDGDEI